MNPKGHEYIARQSYRGHVLRRGSVAHVKKKCFSQVSLNEQVFCFKTETGHFLARHNGKVFVAGNCDALRYLMMSNFAKAGRVSAAKEPPAKPTSVSTSPQYTPMWMAQQVQAQTGASNTQESSDLGSARGKKGSFMWDLG